MDIADVGNGMGNFLDYEPPDTSNILLIGLQGAGKTSLMVAVERMDMTLAQQREAQVFLSLLASSSLIILTLCWITHRKETCLRQASHNQQHVTSIFVYRPN